MRLTLIIAASLASSALSPPACAQGFATGEPRRLHDLSMALDREGRRDEAILTARKGLALCFGQDGLRFSCRSALADVLGMELLRRGDAAEAEQALRLSVDAGLSAFGPNHPALGPRYQGLANALRTQGRLEDALDASRRMLAAAEEKGGHVLLSEALCDLARSLTDLGRASEALPLALRAESVLSAAADIETPEYASAADWAAILLIREGRAAEAEGPAGAALEIYERIGPEDRRAAALETLADCLAGTGRAAETEALRAQEVEARRNLVPQDAAQLASALARLGALRRTLGRPEAAASSFAEAVEAWERVAPGSAASAEAMTGLGIALMEAGRPVEAAAALARALSTAAELGEAPRQIARRAWLARALRDAGVTAPALTMMQESAQALERLSPPEPALLVNTLIELGRTLLSLNQPREAQAQFEHARDVLAAAGLGAGVDAAEVLEGLAGARLALGDSAGAAGLLEASIQSAAGAGEGPGPIARKQVGLARARLAIADLAGAERALDAAAASLEPGGASLERVWLRTARAELAGRSRRTAEADEALDAAASDLEALAGGTDGARRAAQGFSSLGRAASGLGRHARAAAFGDRAIALAEQISDGPVLLGALSGRRETAIDAGTLDAAEAAAKRAADVAAELHGPDHPETYIALLALATVERLRGRYGEARALLDRTHPSSDALRARQDNERGLILYETGRFTEAAAEFERELSVFPDAPPRDRANALINLASMRRRDGGRTDAARLLHEALALLPAPEAADDLLVATALHGLGLERLAAGRLEEAETLCRQALQMRERMGVAGRDLALSWAALAAILEARGMSPDAEAPRRRALEVTLATDGPEHPDTAARMAELAGTLSTLGRIAEARELERQAAAITERSLDADDPSVLLIRSARAREEGDLAGAEREAARAASVQEARLGPGHPALAEALMRWAWASQDLGDARLSASLAARAVAIREPAGGRPLAEALLGAGDLASAAGDLDGAGALLARSLEVEEAAAGVRGAMRPRILMALGRVRLRLGDDPGARSRFEEAFAMTRDSLGPEAPALAVPIAGQADVAAREGGAEALPLRERALALLEGAGADDRALTWLLQGLVFDRVRAGQADRAAEALARLEAAPGWFDAGTRADTLGARAAVLDARGDAAGAEAALRSELALLKEATCDVRASIAAVLNDAALVAGKLRPDAPDEEAMLREALAAAEAAVGPDHPMLAQICVNLAFALEKRGRGGEADAMRARAAGLAKGWTPRPATWL